MCMEKRKLILLKYFLNNCTSGYKVIETAEIYAKNKKYKKDFQLLQEDISFLKKYKYIDVKYIDEINICVSVLDNSHILQENIKSERNVSRKHLSIMLLNMVVSGVMAFIGAFLAIILIR